MAMGLGKRIRLRRLCFGEGPAAGRLLLLAAYQGLEHGPRAFAAIPESADPEQALRLAVDGSCSGVILSVGLAERYLGMYAGRIPLVLSLNGRTDIPPDDEALAPLTASVEDAVRLGADGVLYRLYLGSPAQYEDLTQLAGVRRDCVALGMPLLVSPHPSGAAVERRGGSSSQYALEYGARAADELGADLVILCTPVANAQRDAQTPKPYPELHTDPEAALSRLVAWAGGTPVVVDLGDPGDQDLAGLGRRAIAAGAKGVLVRDGAAQRPVADAVARMQGLAAVLAQEAG
jgi:class I fructose-bisphosphate aldolase